MIAFEPLPARVVANAPTLSGLVAQVNVFVPTPVRLVTVTPLRLPVVAVAIGLENTTPSASVQPISRY